VGPDEADTLYWRTIHDGENEDLFVTIYSTGSWALFYDSALVAQGVEQRKKPVPPYMMMSIATDTFRAYYRGEIGCAPYGKLTGSCSACGAVIYRKYGPATYPMVDQTGGRHLHDEDVEWYIIPKDPYDPLKDWKDGYGPIYGGRY
jgi:hypothetical protein